MLLDARSVPGGSDIETDICIVGAGAAGISLALELAGSPLRVALLESGGLEAEPETQALYRGRVFGRRYFSLDTARTRRFGGSTNCWQGICAPLSPLDFEAREWVVNSGWPFSAEELEPFYVRARRICGLPSEPASPSGEGASALPFEGPAIETRLLDVHPRRFGQDHRHAVTRARNVRTYLHANVIEIETPSDGGRITSVRVATLEGGRFSVRARWFVLATGAIENARLLLASNRIRSAGIGNEHDWVGRNFMEHPHVVAAVFLPSYADLSLDLYEPPGGQTPASMAVLGLSEATQRSERLMSAFIRPVSQADLPDFERALASVVGDIDNRRGGPAQRAHFFLGQCEQAPNPSSRVRLIEQRDALGMPRVQLEWRLSDVDQRSLRRSHEILARELGRAGLGRLQLLLSEFAPDWPEDLGGGRHHMGTTRMSDDPERGVVDRNARVHSVSNLFVAGSSVFPTSGAVGPTLTLVALAIRLADQLKQLRA